MIAAVKWYAAIAALWLVPPPPASAADDLPGAARELARKTAVLVGRGESVAVTWRNSSSLSSKELAQAREVFERALQSAAVRVSDTRGNAGDSLEAGLGAGRTNDTPGGRPGDPMPAEARLTLSENRSQYLLVEEVRRSEERQVWIAGWKRPEAAASLSTGLSLEKKLLWEQSEPILDVAVSGDTMLVLSPVRLVWLQRQNGQWSQAASIDPPELKSESKTMPRDPRGRLRVSGSGLEAYLPGISCKITIAPSAFDCKTADDAWMIESGSRFLLAANFASKRNYFDGHITTQSGIRKTIAPFYSAAAIEDAGKALWLVAMLDGRTQIFDSSWEPSGSIASWGSDIAGIDTRCGGRSAVLATRSGDAHEPDAIQAFTIANGAPVPLSQAMDFPGPVTALWPSGGNSAVAVVRDSTARYAAYLLTVGCGS